MLTSGRASPMFHNFQNNNIEVKEQHLPLGQGPHDKFYQAQKKF
jgi:hypothetical protein